MKVSGWGKILITRKAIEKAPFDLDLPYYENDAIF
jgi:hypothetical protein